MSLGLQLDVFCAGYAFGLGPGSPTPPWPPCQAPSADIKRAYHALMREVHPDRAPAGLQEQMAGLCVLLNEIYEVGHEWASRSGLRYGHRWSWRTKQAGSTCGVEYVF